MKQTHLKKNGRAFLFTENLAKRGDMVPCDAKGNIAVGHAGDAQSIEATNNRRKTKYLGSTKNGVLYPYTEYLAQRDEMELIDTIEQWEAMRNTGDAPKQDSNAIVPTTPAAKPVDETVTLGRTKAEESEEIPVAVQEGSGADSLPVIEGMGAREAKTVLSDWAQANYNQKIDRRPPLDDVIKVCQEIASSNEQAQVAG